MQNRIQYEYQSSNERHLGIIQIYSERKNSYNLAYFISVYTRYLLGRVDIGSMR